MVLDLQALQEQGDAVRSLEQLEQYKEQTLGKNGSITLEFKQLPTLSPEEKKQLGAHLSQAKALVEGIVALKSEAFVQEHINQKLLNDPIDISLDLPHSPQGHLNLLQKFRRTVEEVFMSMGFNIEYGPEVVTKYENFFSLNFRPGHPAIEMHDTIYVDTLDTQGEELILRTHTSAAQNLLMKKYGVPCRVCIPSRVYRFEDLDASHDTMFMQVEGFVIDKGVSIAHFKNVIGEVLNAIFEREVQVRMRPAYFPFVEPGFEIDASCPLCDGKGCSLCKQSGWIEIMGAGMIHPNVLKEAHIDIQEYSGFAFGMGINRMCAIKYGIKDIRLFTNGDIRFVQSFE